MIYFNTIFLTQFKWEETHHIMSNKIHQHDITLDNSIKFHQTRYFHKIRKLEMTCKKKQYLVLDIRNPIDLIVLLFENNFFWQNYGQQLDINFTLLFKIIIINKKLIMLHQWVGSMSLRVEKLKLDTLTKTVRVIAGWIEYTRK